MRATHILAAFLLAANSWAVAQISWKPGRVEKASDLTKVVFSSGAFYASGSLMGEMWTSLTGEIWTPVVLKDAPRQGIYEFAGVGGGALILGRDCYWTPLGEMKDLNARCGRVHIAYLNGVAIISGLLGEGNGEFMGVTPQFGRWRDSTSEIELVDNAPSIPKVSEWVIATDSEFLLKSAFYIYASVDGFHGH
ncbi:MAG: hypothetical protein V4726_12925 [Verrucomicrobiota bacterium]